jgi:hypothetical protein
MTMRRVRQACALGFVLLAAAAGAPAALAAIDRPFPLVTVVGEGAASIVPDLAHATAGVHSEAKTPREATEANAKAMNAVVAAVRQAGVEERDIRTSRFSISPVYAPRREGAPQLTGYRVTNQVRVTVRDHGKVGEVLDQMVAAGANQISGVEFTVAEPSKLLDEARSAAFADAKRKAELYAKAAGAQIGRAVAIAEEDAQPPRAVFRAERAALAAPAAATPVSAGEETLRVQVTVSFELNQ